MSEIRWHQRKAFYTPDYFDGELEGHYRKWWWTDVSVWGPRARLVYEAFKPANALVCGCAKGSLVKFLHGVYGVDAKGFDLSQYAINTTPYPDIRDRLLVLDLALEYLPFGDESFDVVACFDFLEHNDGDHLQHVCDEVARVAKKIILIRSPIAAISDSEAAEIVNETKGLAIGQRFAALALREGYREWEPDASNLEHPNNRGRKDICRSFREFVEVFLEPYLYDITMGNGANPTPVLPFYDSVVLCRKETRQAA